MKTKIGKLFLLLGVFALIFASCSKDDDENNDDAKSFPEKFTVDIPSSISSATTKSLLLKQGEKLNGGEIYSHLRNFIAIGEGGALMVQAIMISIRVYDLAQPLDIEYQEKDDGDRTKHLVVLENQTFEGIEYDFGLTITDKEYESNADGGVGMQVFWNSKPVEGVAIIKGKNLNASPNKNDIGDGMVRIDYSETGETGYDATMEVTIVDFPLADSAVDQYTCDRIKMFVGKKGDIVDVYGNSNHPYACLLNNPQPEDVGIDYAFVASANDPDDYAVAQVGLPPVSLNSTSRSSILEDYSIKKVFVNAVAENYQLSPALVESVIDQYLINATPPGFFENSGFVAAGTAPDSKYDPLVSNINKLTPYSPYEVANMSLSFKE